MKKKEPKIIDNTRNKYPYEYYDMNGFIDYDLLCLYQKDPTLFLDFWYGKNEPRPESKAMKFEKMLHAAIFNPDWFKNGYSIANISTPKNAHMEKFCKAIIAGKKPTEAYLANYNVLSKDAPAKARELYKKMKDYICWYKRVGGKHPISENEMGKIRSILDKDKAMIENIQEYIIHSMNNGWSELEVRFYHDCGLECRAKIDHVQIDKKHKEGWITNLIIAPQSFGYFFLQKLAYQTMAVKEAFKLGAEWTFEYPTIYINSKTFDINFLWIEETMEHHIRKINKDISAINAEIERRRDKSMVERTGINYGAEDIQWSGSLQ